MDLHCGPHHDGDDADADADEYDDENGDDGDGDKEEKVSRHPLVWIFIAAYRIIIMLMMVMVKNLLRSKTEHSESTTNDS